MNFDIRYYLSICFRRLPIFLPIAVVLAAASVFVAMSLPAKFQSDATLLVESAQISDTLAESTVTVDPNEQLQIIRQRLMTRANLLDIARKFDVYKDMDLMTADEIIRRMNADSTIRVQSGRAQATQMGLGFTALNAQTAAAVLNEYITVILSESAQFRKSRAEGTLEFFEQEVERLNNALDQQSSRILVFQNDNADALPSTLDYRLTRQGQLQERLAINERERISLEDQKVRIAQIFELTGGTQAVAGPPTPLEAELDRMERELAQALLVYSTENPRVKILQGRVDALRTQVEAEQATRSEEESPQKIVVDLQIEELDQRINALVALNEKTQAEIDSLQESIDRTSANEISLSALQREYTILENQYNAAVARLNTAATGERIEVLSKGERITIVEQPSVPQEPSSPNRRLIAAAGSAAAIGFAAAIVVLLELLNSAIRRPVDLTNRFGITPIGVLPVIRTPADRFFKGTVLLAAVAFVVVGVPASLFAVHTYYLPLDLIADKVMNRLGI